LASTHGTHAAQEAFDADALGTEPLRFETCPHRPPSRLHLSGTTVRALLQHGQPPPPEFSRPGVARLLVDGCRATPRG
jgi:sulfate adenylyltransferase